MADNQIGHYPLSQRVDQVEKEATEQMTILALMLLDPGPPNLSEDPAYTTADLWIIQHLPKVWQPQQQANW